MAQTETQKLYASVNTVFNAIDRNGVKALDVLLDTIRHTSVHRDWDAMARFLARAEQVDRKYGVMTRLVIRAAFGDKIKLAKDVKAKNGYRFTLGWNIGEEFAFANTFAIVMQHREEGCGIVSKRLYEALKPAKADPKAKSNEELLKATLKYVMGKVGDGLSPEAIITAVRDEVTKLKAEGKLKA